MRFMETELKIWSGLHVIEVTSKYYSFTAGSDVSDRVTVGKTLSTKCLLYLLSMPNVGGGGICYS